MGLGDHVYIWPQNSHYGSRGKGYNHLDQIRWPSFTFCPHTLFDKLLWAATYQLDPSRPKLMKSTPPATDVFLSPLLVNWNFDCNSFGFASLLQRYILGAALTSKPNSLWLCGCSTCNNLLKKWRMKSQVHGSMLGLLTLCLIVYYTKYWQVNTLDYWYHAFRFAAAIEAC